MRRIIIIVFLSFTVFAFVCCDSKKEARMRYEVEQQSRDKHFEERREENRQWQHIHMRTSRPGGYEIFQHQQFAKNAFLLDTMDGRVWILTQDQETKKLWWTELDIENRDTIKVKEFFKNEAAKKKYPHQNSPRFLVTVFKAGFGTLRPVA